MANVISKVWLVEQFNQIHKADMLLLARTEDIQKQNGMILVQVNKLMELTEPNPYVIPELEAALREVMKRTNLIDEKVPDKNVPPGTSAP